MSTNSCSSFECRSHIAKFEGYCNGVNHIKRYIDGYSRVYSHKLFVSEKAKMVTRIGRIIYGVLRMIQRAWTIPGIYPRQVRRMLINKSAPQPRSKNTPSGGRRTAQMMEKMSLPAPAMVVRFV